MNDPSNPNKPDSPSVRDELISKHQDFNSLNRQVALYNIQRIGPSLSTILINIYRAPTELLVDGDVIVSQEGTTHGDPLSMPTYAL